MKKYTITLLLAIVSLLAYGQKYDNTWIFGTDLEGDNEAPFGSNVLSFEDSGELLIEHSNRYSGTHSVSTLSMSDREGNLIFYSNGAEIKNLEGEIMEGGEVINPGEIRDNYLPAGYPVHQNLIGIPDPAGSENLYYLFHFGMIPYTGIHEQIDKIYLTTIDMSANGGLGKVVDANTILMEGAYDIPAATRHGNGRDWWILIPDMFESAFYRFTFSNEGVSPIDTQYIEKVTTTDKARKKFSLDGSKYAFFDNFEGLGIYDFDRCSGLLSNPKIFDFDESNPFVHAGGVEISPNNRFAYTTFNRRIHQYDLWEDNLDEAVDTILLFEGSLDTVITATQYGPDEKIYISSGGISKSLSVINNPNGEGELCDIVLNQVEMPSYAGRATHYFPNYRLYDLQDSPCDTLGINGAPPVSITEIEKEERITISPNPTSDELTISLNSENIEEETITVAIRNSVGQLVKETITMSNNLKVNVTDLPHGLYYVTISNNGNIFSTEKVIITE